MATTRPKPAANTEPAGGTPPPETPSFAAIAHAPETPPAAEPKQPEASAPPTEERDLKKWYEAQPQWAREEYEKQHADFVLAGIYQQLGPRANEIVAVLNDPDAREALGEIAADPELRKRIGRLKDKNVQAFALQRAIDIWDDQQEQHGREGTPPPDATTKRVEALESQLDRERNQREYDQYVAYRQQEMGALINEQPSLRFTTPESREYKYMAYLQDQAHAMSIRYNRFVSLKEVYDQDRSIHGTGPLPAAPATTQGDVGDAGPNQAPRTPTESSSRMAAQLKKAGGFRALAETARRK